MIQRLMMICLILAVVLGGGYYAYRQLVPPPEDIAEGPVFSTHKVARGDISVGVEAIGPLNPSQAGALEAPHGHVPGGSVIDKILVEPGEPVRQGQVVAVLTAPDMAPRIRNLEEQLKSQKEALAKLLDLPETRLDNIDPARGITLRAPIAGRVVGLAPREGTELKQGQIVAQIVDDSYFRLTARLVQDEFNRVRVGGKVVLQFPQFDGVVPAVIKDINPNPVLAALSELELRQNEKSEPGERLVFVYWVEIEGQNPGLIRPGMVAHVGLLPEGQAPDGHVARQLRFPVKIEGYVNEETVLNRATAIVSRVFVREMALVQSGDALVSLAGRAVQDDIEARLARIRQLETELQELHLKKAQLEIKAPMDGVLAHLAKRAGQTVQPGEWLGAVYNTAEMHMCVQVDDVDVLLVRHGSPVEVTLEALPGKTLEGKVTQIDAMGQQEGGIALFGVHINVRGVPELRPGMQAQARISAGKAQEVLLVPLEAIFGDKGQPRVEVLHPDGNPRVVAVELGLMSHHWAEVKSGLVEGDLVVTGSTADLLLSQRIQAGTNLLPGTPGDRQARPGSPAAPGIR